MQVHAEQKLEWCEDHLMRYLRQSSGCFHVGEILLTDMVQVAEFIGTQK